MTWSEMSEYKVARLNSCKVKTSFLGHALRGFVTGRDMYTQLFQVGLVDGKGGHGLKCRSCETLSSVPRSNGVTQTCGLSIPERIEIDTTYHAVVVPDTPLDPLRKVRN